MAETTTIKGYGTQSVHAPIGHIKIGTSIPTTVAGYYGGSRTLTDDEWRGGEVFFHTGNKQLFVQTSTSGTTAVWKRLLTAFTAA